MSVMSDGGQKRTPLYDEHVRRGAKMVAFGGWLMPVQYTSIVEEHRAVRENIGVFDTSHMGQMNEMSNTPMFSRTARCSSTMRSEEHTSELQSRGHLLCRLLLEK